MKIKPTQITPLFILGIVLLFTSASSQQLSKSEKNSRSQAYLQKFPGNLIMPEACVICRYVMQKIDNEIDTSRECPEIAQSSYVQQKQQELKVDPKFLAKWKQYYELKKKQEQDLGQNFRHTDDHFYYVIHPSHVSKYVGKINMQYNQNNYQNQEKIQINPQQQQEQNPSQNTEQKSVIYYDKDPQKQFPNEVKITHQVGNDSSQVQKNNNGLDSQWQQNQENIDQLLKNSEKVRFQEKEKNFEDVVFRINENQVASKQVTQDPYQVSNSRLKRIFKNSNQRFNQDPQVENQLDSTDDIKNPLTGKFIIDKNIQQNANAPTSILLPKEDTIQQNPIFQKTNQRHINQIEQPRFSQQQSNGQEEPTNNKVEYSPAFSKIEDQSSTYVNTDTNIYDLMDSNQVASGYGKALFPPHPEDMQPGVDCCMMQPCQNKIPCSQLENPAIQNNANQFRFVETNKVKANPNQVEDDSKEPQSQEQETKQTQKSQDETEVKKLQIDNQNIYYVPPLNFIQQLDSTMQRQNIQSFLEEKNSVYLIKNKKHHNKQNPNVQEETQQETILTNAQKELQEYNPETGRRGRRRSNLPDPSWDCLEKNIKDLVHYLCEQEIALSFTKYCQPIIEQNNIIVESFLYHDTTYQTCQNLHMCPL